jgi:Asp/Glu/hydantoin racemase
LVPGNADQTESIGAAQLRSAGLAGSVDFEFRPVRISPRWWDSRLDWLLGEIAYFDAGADAQTEGYDAVCVLSAGDMAINQLRSVLDIPVVGGGKLAYLTALMVGTRFSLLIHWESWRFFYQEAIEAYGLRERCASIRSIYQHIDVHDVGDWKEGQTKDAVARLVQEGRRCVTDDGADVVCLPVGLYYAHAEVQANLPVPVINAGAVTLKLTEALLDLGLNHSRASQPRGRQPEIGLFHEMVNAAISYRARTQ